MDVVRKDATIVNTDDAFPGSFEVILSAPTKDRDGDVLLPGEWKQPLPDHITFDVDHEMSVKGTVGSGSPRIDDQGRLIVSGTYSSLPRAQETRTLVKEGHIRTTSVAFMSEKTQKDGVQVVQRELLNGAFVAVPSNREALILSAKSAAVKAGRRNSTTDQAHLDAILAHAVALGATDGDADDTAKSFTGVIVLKDALQDVFARHQAGEITADEALTLIQDANTSTDEPTPTTGEGDPDEEPDSGATPTPTVDAAKAASTAEVKATPVEDASIDQQVMAARKRAYYAINLTEGI